MVFSCLIRALRVVVFVARLLFLLTPAFAQTSSIIVHCHNPEGKEINSIQGMAGTEVEIYYGDTLVGYGVKNAQEHNQPVSLPPGNHTFKAKFNGIELSQSIHLDEGETKTLTFTFPRTEFNHKGFLNSIGPVSASRTYTSGGQGISCVDFYIDPRFPEVFPCFGAAATLYTRNAVVSSYTHVSFNINGDGISANIGAVNSVEHLPVKPPDDTYYAMNIGAFEGHWNG